MAGPQPPEAPSKSAASPRTSAIARHGTAKQGHVTKLRNSWAGARQDSSSGGVGRQTSFNAARQTWGGARGGTAAVSGARPSSAKLTAAERRAKKAAQEEAIRL